MEIKIDKNFKTECGSGYCDRSISSVDWVQKGIVAIESDLRPMGKKYQKLIGEKYVGQILGLPRVIFFSEEHIVE